MSYALIPLIVVAAVVFLLVSGIREERQRKRALHARLREGCGKPPRAYGRETSVPVFEGKAENGRFCIDRITWEELEMDSVFKRLDYTLSQAGTEYLYRALHQPAETAEEVQRWEDAVAYFTTHEEERIRIQEILAAVGKEKGSPFADCLRAMKARPPEKPIREYGGWVACLLAGLMAIWAGGPGICLLLFVLIIQMVTYFSRRAQVLPFLRHIAWLLAMIRSLEQLYHALPREICRRAEADSRCSEMAVCIRKLKRLQRHSFWIRQCRSGNGPLSLLGDYIRMLLHPDIVQFLALQEKILSLEEELRAGYAFVGYVDASISVSLYRMSLDVYCIPTLCGGSGSAGVTVCDCVHPLLEQPVANSIVVTETKGILLTGSNASGKSTFLKTIAVNLLLAQTIHTALAAAFCAPFCHIFTAMADGGDLQGGKSSYMAEILSLKRILDAKREGALPVACFVDEILRGTGSVERIAAAASILRHLGPPEVICFAATHDRELTWLLENEYDTYYFTEEVQGGDMIFPYRLLPGRADTTNAIRLLAAVGYGEEIVEEAFRRAEEIRGFQAEDIRI